MSLTIPCPYCNAVVPVSTEQVAAAQRVPCPRCGEAVPAAQLAGVGGTNVGSVTPPADSAPAPELRRRNLGFGLGLIAAMVFLAAVVAVALVLTRGKRGLTMLAESEAIGYLPDDTNVIVALNVAEAERGEQAREAIDRLGFGAGGSFDLERAVGLKRDQVVAAVLGLRLDRNAIPRTRLVVRTRSDIDAEALRDRLGANRSRQEGGREYHLFRAPGLALEMALWLPDPRTVVAVYPVDEFALVPASPSDRVERFAAPIADLLRNRSERDTILSVIAHSDDWQKTALPLHLAALPLSLKADDRKLLYEVRTIGLALRKDSGATATRSRPARITEEPAIDPRGVALDLWLTAGPDADLPVLVDAFQGWVDRQQLQVRGAERTGSSYTATLVGRPEDWERALASLRGQAKR